jgi:hypothetical protein
MRPAGGEMQVKPSEAYSRDALLDCMELQSFCHLIVSIPTFVQVKTIAELRSVSRTKAAEPRHPQYFAIMRISMKVKYLQQQ